MRHETLCTIQPKRLAGWFTCLHFECRLADLRNRGKGRVADRLARNGEAKDWARNWGLMLYDPRMHGRDAKRRMIMARMIRAMRKGGMSYAGAVTSGAWLGATID